MKLNKNRDFEKSGIYCIRNIINNKVYIGKAKCIYKRIKDHITALNTKNKDENYHLIQSWHKYGKDNFEYFVIEYLELDEKLISKRELYWINYYQSLNPLKGYNKRLDSSTGMIVHESTRKKLSEAQINRFENQHERDKLSENLKLFWKNNPEIKKTMALNVSKAKQKYTFHKCNEDGSIIETFNTIEDIIFKNPSYKWQNIYSVCNGYKKRIYGFKWIKELKI